VQVCACQRVKRGQSYLNLYKLDGFVTDLALNNPLFNAISPVIESAKISRIFLVVLANSLAIDLSMQDHQLSD
jgi:hypothetical protein